MIYFDKSYLEETAGATHVPVERGDSIRVGISSCLLGRRVRFDAGHKQDRYITNILAHYFEFVPVCPEMEVGMGIPREAVHLEGGSEAPRMIGVKSGEDWTDMMNSYSKSRVEKSDLSAISGYILKKDSPSCGMERVRLHGPAGQVRRIASGLYASALKRHNPLLPVEEEGRLYGARLRENFIVRVFAFHRLNQLFATRFSPANVIRFHTIHKYILMAHSPELYGELGRLVARMKTMEQSSFRDSYSRVFMAALQTRATTKKNTNVLLHILGFLKKHLEPGDKARILEIIEDYHREMAPLIVPITLVKHYIDKFEIEYMGEQVYLNPHPKELMLRNHV